MADFIADFIREIIMLYPGALLRYLFLHKKYSFKEITEQDTIWNFLLSLFIIGVIVLTVGHYSR